MTWVSTSTRSGFFAVNSIFEKSAIVGVDHRESAARRVARGHSGAVDHREIQTGCRRATGVQHFAPPAPTITRELCSRRPLHTLYLGDGALTTETVDLIGKSGLPKAETPGVGE
jgi:hypothetical protein